MGGNKSISIRFSSELLLLRGERIGVEGNFQASAIFWRIAGLAKGRKDWGGGKLCGTYENINFPDDLLRGERIGVEGNSIFMSITINALSC